jgi:hypothetical protein
MKKQVIDIAIPGNDACGTCVFLYAVTREKDTGRITTGGCSLYDNTELNKDYRTDAFCRDSICQEDYPEGVRFRPA